MFLPPANNILVIIKKTLESVGRADDRHMFAHNKKKTDKINKHQDSSPHFPFFIQVTLFDDWLAIGFNIGTPCRNFKKGEGNN